MLSVLVLLKNPENAAMDFARRLKDIPGVSVASSEDWEGAKPHLAKAELLITLGVHLGEIAGAVFEQARSLKWVQVIGTGVDNIVGNPALPPGVAISNVRGVHGSQMSEAALGAMLSFARQIPRIVRNQDHRHWERFPARLLRGSTVGIFGMGAIAEALAPRCKALGMTVVGFTGARRPVPGFDEVFERQSLPARAGELDYLVVLAPHTPETHHAIGASIFAGMKPSAVLINLARGGVVDDSALLDALDNGRLAGAALDVFETEPLPPDHPFWTHPKVLVSPHVGGFHEGYADDVGKIVNTNVRRYLEGGPEALLFRVA